MADNLIHRVRYTRYLTSEDSLGDNKSSASKEESVKTGMDTEQDDKSSNLQEQTHLFRGQEVSQDMSLARA